MNIYQWIGAGSTILILWGALLFGTTQKFRTLVCRYRGHRWGQVIKHTDHVAYVSEYCEFCGVVRKQGVMPVLYRKPVTDTNNN